MQSSGETHRENAGVCPVFRIVGMGRSYLMHRHCEEPTGPASAGPMTGSATTIQTVTAEGFWIASLRSQ